MQLQTTHLGAPDIHALHCSAVSLLRGCLGGRNSLVRVWVPPIGISATGERGLGLWGAQRPSLHLRGGKAPFRFALGEDGTSTGGWGWRGRGRAGRRRLLRQQGNPSVLKHIRQRWLTMGRCRVASSRLHKEERSPGPRGLGHPSYEPRTLQRPAEKVRTAESLTALPRVHLAMKAQG